jgi:membrane-associated protease RseP (regulator of RpoE activity)
VSEPRAGPSSAALIAGLIVAAAVVTWSVLAVDRRAAVESTAIDPRAGTVAPPAAISAPVPLSPVSTVAMIDTAAVVDTTYQDQRQTAKITRGLAASPSGGILVEATSSDTLASQLRLEAGDVIVSVNGSPVSSPQEFARIYREQGLPRQMTVIHNGSETHHH